MRLFELALGTTLSYAVVAIIDSVVRITEMFGSNSPRLPRTGRRINEFASHIRSSQIQLSISVYQLSRRVQRQPLTVPTDHHDRQDFYSNSRRFFRCVPTQSPREHTAPLGEPPAIAAPSPAPSTAPFRGGSVSYQRRASKRKPLHLNNIPRNPVRNRTAPHRHPTTTHKKPGTLAYRAKPVQHHIVTTSPAITPTNHHHMGRVGIEPTT